ADAERVRCLLELRHEATLHAFAKVAALLTRYRVRGLALRNVLELGALHDFLTKRSGFRARGRRVSSGDDPRDRHDRETRAADRVEVALVLIEVGAEIGVGDRLGCRGVGDGRERDVADLRAVVLVTPRTPQFRVGHVRAGRDLVEELFTRDFT